MFTCLSGAPNPKLNLKEEYVDTWKIMVREVLNKGKARSLGVSNFTIAQLERLREESDVIPAVNQVELHLYLQQPELRHYCQSRGIQVQCLSPSLSHALFSPLSQSYSLSLSVSNYMSKYVS